MAEHVRTAIKAIWDRSKDENVDVSVAEAMVRNDVINGVITDMSVEDLDAAGTYADSRYAEICEAYKVSNLSALGNID